ncbi:MAG: hypothetical protein ACT4PG_05505 [Panacagrimonas sp.]
MTDNANFSISNPDAQKRCAAGADHLPLSRIAEALLDCCAGSPARSAA